MFAANACDKICHILDINILI